MVKIITSHWLNEHKVCSHVIKKFEEVFGDGVPIEDVFTALLQHGKFSWAMGLLSIILTREMYLKLIICAIKKVYPNDEFFETITKKGYTTTMEDVNKLVLGYAFNFLNISPKW